MIKVGVIFGGVSVEHEVGIITAVQAMEFMNPKKYEIVPIYITKEGYWYTSEKFTNMETFKDLSNIDKIATKIALVKENNEFALHALNKTFNKTINTIDIAFPIVHGKGVEDGSLAGFLSTLGIPYVGPQMLGASIGQDKVVQKQLLSAEGINVPNYVWFYDNEWEENENKLIKEIENLNYPVIVKPARLGSSIGITFAKNKESLIEAVNEAITYDNKVIVEETIKNLQEIDCAVVGNYRYQETAPLGEFQTDNNFLTFEDKYIGESNKKNPKTSGKISVNGFTIPANLDAKTTKEIEELSIKAFKILNLSGVTRFDYLVDKETKKIYLNEPNTIPGCLAFFFFKANGKDYTTLLDEMIATTVEDYKKEQRRVTNFDSNILSTYENGSGSKNKMNVN